MRNLPEGWTDDMNIVVPAGRSLEELVDYVLEGAKRGDARTTLVQHLSENFDLTQADAELAIDRACGGVVRAATGRADNFPAREKDPIAWFSYQKSLERPDLISALCPQLAKTPRKSWWRRLLS